MDLNKPELVRQAIKEAITAGRIDQKSSDLWTVEAKKGKDSGNGLTLP
jgi:hypothetical protein